MRTVLNLSGTLWGLFLKYCNFVLVLLFSGLFYNYVSLCCVVSFLVKMLRDEMEKSYEKDVLTKFLCKDQWKKYILLEMEKCVLFDQLKSMLNSK